ncbi:MAG: DNA polymerase III subunit delta [Ferruginibacter sp.]|nr:DNA polymerase III subunit delta [Ferruginibacter sp.]
MSVQKILGDWKKKQYKPVYWIYGEEDYFIDVLADYAEKNILNESEASFNLTVFYGKDAEWTAVINACKRYPMFAEKQVVLLREAQLMNAIEKLESYVEEPLGSTIFIIAYKGKGLDKRTKLHKLLEKNADVFHSQKIREDKIHDWIITHVKEKGYAIGSKAAILLEEHLGNDLSRIDNEISKISVNLKEKKSIDEDDVEKYVGISKEYNIFELQAAIAFKDLAKAIKIISYFESNPKSAPIQLALPSLYAFFSKVYTVFGLADRTESALKPVFFYNPSALKQGMAAVKNFGFPGVEKIILLLNQYNLKSVGINDGGTEGASLLREMVVKIFV